MRLGGIGVRTRGEYGASVHALVSPVLLIVTAKGADMTYQVLRDAEAGVGLAHDGLLLAQSPAQRRDGVEGL